MARQDTRMSDDASIVDKVKENMKKFLTPNSKPTMETFPELVDCIVWLRFVLAVFFGVWIGKQGGGGSSILAILNFITFPPIFYCRTFLAADADSYGSKLYFSGVVQGLALATLIWVYFFTDSHTQDEAALASVLDNVAADQEVVSSNIGDDATMDVDSEF